MVKLFCAIVGAAGNAFEVDIDEAASVSALKYAIKRKKLNKITCDADDLQLFLAKTADGAWLESDSEDVKKLKKGEKTGAVEALTSEEKELQGESGLQKVLRDMPQPSADQIHVLVVVPTEDVVVPALPQPPFFWKEAKSLVATTGASWDFQNSLDLGKVASAIGRHYRAWSDGKTDKRSHPLFVCLDGPGTGKSRLLDEFPNVLQQRIFCDETHGDPAMKQLLREAFVFKITLENGTATPGNFANPGQAIGTRMLFQLQNSVGWELFLLNRANHVVPEQVFTKLSAISRTDSRQMCVILCVDSLQKLQHEPGSKRSEFYSAFASLCDLVNASKCWVIVICSATIYQPVDEFLAASPQWREMLQTTRLERPKINGRDVFDTFNDGMNGSLTQLLVGDMGGHGRALEELFNVMLENQGKAFEFIPVVRSVLSAIRQAYPAIVAQMGNMRQAFLAVISRRTVDGYSRFGSLTLDQVISCGLIRLNETHLECPYVLYMLLETHDFPWSKHATYAPVERFEDLKPWQLWEQFNCKFRASKRSYPWRFSSKRKLRLQVLMTYSSCIARVK